MPEPLKNIFNPVFFEHFTATIKKRIPDFNEQHFIYRIFDTNWEGRELKQRIRHISTALKDYLPGNYRQQIRIITGLIEDLKTKGKEGGLEYIFFPDFIEQYGLDDLQTSLDAM